MSIQKQKFEKGVDTPNGKADVRVDAVETKDDTALLIGQMVMRMMGRVNAAGKNEKGEDPTAVAELCLGRVIGHDVDSEATYRITVTPVN